MGPAKSSRFTRTDSIAEALAAQPALAGRLSGLNPALACFGDAAAARSVGDRVTLADVARMAEVSVDDLVAFVNGDGSALAPIESESAGRPAWIDGIDEAQVPAVDARAILATGVDPFAEITALAATITANGAFIVDAPFDPAPLRRYLGSRGYSAFSEKRGERHWRVYFRRDGGDGRLPPDEAELGDRDTSVHLDLRGMEPPRPMIAILRLIDQAAPSDPVIVALDREPIFLYPELVERGWAWTVLDDGSEGQGVRLRLFTRDRRDES